MRKKIFRKCLAHLGKEKDSFQVDWVEISEHLTLSDHHKEVKNEIVSFIDSKAESFESIEKREIEALPHFKDLPCSLEMVLTYDSDINESLRCYIWALIQSCDIIAEEWDSFDDIISSEISYLSEEQ